MVGCVGAPKGSEGGARERNLWLYDGGSKRQTISDWCSVFGKVFLLFFFFLFFCETQQNSLLLCTKHIRTNSDLVKLINLCHDWLQCLFPHVLSKINRVSFGLLSKEDLERQIAEDPRMPKTRKFLAVPYVGKDVPSPFSEFAHPDIAIGLTIMGYRYQVFFLGSLICDFFLIFFLGSSRI